MSGMPACEDDLRARGSGSGRRCSRATLTTAAGPAGDERLGGDAVDVDVVDDRDVAGPQPLGEVLRPAVDAGRTR